MPNYKRRKIRVLVVDDSVINQEIARDFMEDLGFSVDTADNGLQAVEHVKLHSYSLVCMDIQMPVMDGFASTKAIREHEIQHGLDPVIIIALTSETADGIERRCLDAGMNDYMQKPFSQQEILQKITQWLNDEIPSGSQNGSTTPFTETDDNRHHLYDVVEEVSQISHWFWHFSDQQLQFSKYLQHHFDFPLSSIKTLDDYISKVGGDAMNEIVRECISTMHETRWEQKITAPGMKQSKYILHKFRVVVSEDNSHVLIGTIQDITFIRHTEQQILELASYDSVTGLSSRFRFNLQLEDLIKHAHRHSQKFGLLYFNLGIFNKNNNSYRHGSDDKILIEFTKRFRTILRKSDFACRLINDEFCLAIKDIDDDLVAMKIAARYLKLFEKPVFKAGKDFNLDINIGCAIYPQDGVKAATLTMAANTAMNDAKNTPTFNCAFFESALTNAAQARLVKENELITALERNQFELYYQPIISLHDGEVVSVEANIRWNHPEYKLQLPESFFPDADRMGLMVDIDQWVVRHACDNIKTWSAQGLDEITVAINISEQNFEQADFADNLFKIVSDAGVSPSLISIEITESISRDQKAFTDTCHQLRANGFNIAIDDFGTGYSSLSSLKNIPIDVLIIDREFIRNIPEDTQSSIIIGTILGMSNALGLQVTAKGVENNDQLTTLVAMGCHMAQGRFFNEPVSAAEITGLSKTNYRKPNIHRVA